MTLKQLCAQGTQNKNKIQEKIHKLKGVPQGSGPNTPLLEKNRMSELTIGSGRKGTIKSKKLNEEALMIGVQDERVQEE